jgi:hypothetical protein
MKENSTLLRERLLCDGERVKIDGETDRHFANFETGGEEMQKKMTKIVIIIITKHPYIRCYISTYMHLSLPT